MSVLRDGYGLLSRRPAERPVVASSAPATVAPAVALPTDALAPREPVDVVGRQPMTSFTALLSRLDRCARLGTEDVLAQRDGLKVPRIPARAPAADVVDGQPRRERSDEAPITFAVHEIALTEHLRVDITATVRSEGKGPAPFDAEVAQFAVAEVFAALEREIEARFCSTDTATRVLQAAANTESAPLTYDTILRLVRRLSLTDHYRPFAPVRDFVSLGIPLLHRSAPAAHASAPRADSPTSDRQSTDPTRGGAQA